MNRLTPFCILGFLLIFCGRPEAQTLTDSNLPIVIITIDGGSGIPDEPKVKGNMKIIYSGAGQRNAVTETDPTKIKYNGRIEIEIRGSSSQVLDKKQYGLTTLKADNISNNNVSLLGMPAENDWILSGLAFDASFMRDYLAFTLSRRIGQYAPRTQYCELILNGDYRGIYMLVEKIKVDDNRVDVTKIEPTDNTLPDLSGGYITKADKIAGVDVAAWNMEGNPFGGTNFVHEFPKPNEITPAQNTYIQSVFSSLANRASISSITSGFPSVIDVPSFLDFMLINELGSNVDAYQFSTYFHKDKNAKLRAGPVWDLNLTYGYDLIHWGYDRSHPNVWQFNNNDNVGPQFWRTLFANPTYKCYLAKRWNALTQSGQPLNQISLNALIDETAGLVSEASVREYSRWSGQYSNFQLVADLTTQTNGIKSFIGERITWMTANLGSFSDCNNIVIPPLVITRINYQPETSASFPESSDQEFIEIANTGNTEVDVTGVYFSGTGFVYQFPDNYKFPPNSVAQLANKTSVFYSRHGYHPFGQFTRNLSNTGQKLTLADAFGNVIDEVTYSNLPPWPTVNGNGSHLKLSSVELDNSVGTNWEASSELISSTIVGLEESNAVIIFPNPVNDLFKIEADDIIAFLTIRDAQGRVVETFKPNSTTATLNLNTYANGLYTIMLQIKNKSVIRKLLKL